MALVVITLQDEGEGDEATVDIKFLFEPMVKEDDETGAQGVAARMLGTVSDALGSTDG